MRQKVVKALKTLDAVSIENPVHPGTPDVNYTEGWLELKWARRWPKNASTPLRMDHFTPQQKIWLQRRARKGGTAFLLLNVEQDWLLLTPNDASELLGSATRRELYEVAVWRGNGKSALPCLKRYLQQI